MSILLQSKNFFLLLLSMKTKRFSEYKKHGSPYLKPIQNIFKSGKFTYCLLVTLISLLLKALLLKALLL